MKTNHTLVLTGLLLGATAYAAPEVVGGSTFGVTVATVRELAFGWSMKKQALGRAVYNERDQRIGKIDDVIIAPDKAVSYVIIGTGGFLGMARHDVAIPVDQLKKETDGKIVLNGATKETLKALPEFEYSRRALSE